MVNFCLNITCTFLEKSKFKVESLFCMCRNTCDARYEVCCPLKSCSVPPSTLLVPVLTIRMASNCWFLVLNVAIYNPWIVAYRGKVRAVVLSLWKNSSMWIYARICFALANIAKPILQGTQACTICTQRNAKWHAPSPIVCSPVQNNHAHSRCG